MPYKNPDKRRRYAEGYRAAPEAREAHRVYMRGYNASAAGKLTKRRHAISPKAQQTARTYRLNHKFEYALKTSLYRARRDGYLPVDTTTIRPPHPDRCCDHCFKKPSKRGLCLDHDHLTGRFRGWLCNKCNSALGTFSDSVEGMQRGISYLTGSLHRP